MPTFPASTAKPAHPELVEAADLPDLESYEVDQDEAGTFADELQDGDRTDG